MFRSRCEPEIDLQIHLKDPLDPTTLSGILVELTKSLWNHRQQIPMPFDLLKSELNARGHGELTEPEGMDCDLNPREALKLKRQRIRRNTLDARYLKASSSFVEEADALLKNLSNEVKVNGHSIESVSLVFGATSFSPKESYHIRLAQFGSLSPENDAISQTEKLKLLKKANLALFRALVTHDDLFVRMGKNLKPTNFFIVFRRRKSDLNSFGDWLISRPESSILAHRGKKAAFVLHAPFPTQPQQDPEDDSGTKARKRIRFVSDSRSPKSGERRDAVSYTPVAMEMCTPHPSNRRRFSSGNLLSYKTPLRSMANEAETPIKRLDDMIETPCYTARKRSLRSRSHRCSESDIIPCTPLQAQLLSERKSSTVMLPRSLANMDLECDSEENVEVFVSAKPLKGFKDPRIRLK